MSDKKTDVKFHEEVQKMEYEPLDAVEMKLINGASGSASASWWPSGL